MIDGYCEYCKIELDSTQSETYELITETINVVAELKLLCKSCYEKRKRVREIIASKEYQESNKRFWNSFSELNVLGAENKEIETQ